MSHLLVVILGAAVLAGGAYLQGRADGAELAEGAALREERLVRAAGDQAASAAAGAIARIKVQHTTIRQEVEREIQERPVYVDCRHGPEQLQRINAALGGHRPEPPGVGQLPRADPADR